MGERDPERLRPEAQGDEQMTREQLLQEVQALRKRLRASKGAAALLEVQSQVLECVRASAPLAEVLRVLAQAIEGQAPAMACSVLWLDEDGPTLRHAASPSL